MDTSNIYDLAIIGSGPAGYSASIYASRYKLKNIVFGQLPGGLISGAHKVCNYPGFSEINGLELGFKFQKHAQSLGADEHLRLVTGIKKNNSELFEIGTEDNKTFLAKTVILAVGTKRRKLNLPNEEKFLGHGISYCATCDAMFFKNKTVAVVGGSDAANTASLLLAEIAQKVFQIYRGSSLKGELAWIEQVLKNPKIELIYNTNVTGLLGNETLASVRLDQPYQGQDTIAIQGLFVEIGNEPDAELIRQLSVGTDRSGFILVNPDQSTNIAGVFAAGDITASSHGFRQVITAASEGSIAAHSAYNFLSKNKNY